MSEQTPWPRLLTLSLGLGLTPAVFWRLSLAEWRALVAPPRDVLSRAGFEALAGRFPDG